MSLIEGIGDEVTIVFCLFFLAIVILLAWLSTHTDDRSLFREMGFIVVELTQRRTFMRNAQTEDGNATLPASEGTATESEQGISDELVQAQSPDEPVLDQPSASVESSASLAEVSSNEDMGTDSSTSSHETNEARQSTLQNNEDKGIFSQETDTSHAKTDGEVTIKNCASRDTLSSQLPLDGEEMRQRRVQYFQRDGQLDYQTTNNLSHEHSNSFSVCPKSSQPEEHSFVGSCAKPKNFGSSNTGNGLLNETNIGEDQLAPVSSSTESNLSRENSFQPEASPVDEPDSQIRVKLRYLNETQRYVFAKPDDTIGEFRRTHFQSELEENKWVRFIFNGQDLRDDARTLQACNIVNNSTMHCLVTTQNRTQPQPETATEDEEDSMLGNLMYPLFTILLAIVWYFRFTYRQYFSAMSTVCLIGISFILFLSYISSLRMSDSQQIQQPAPSTSSGTNSRQRPPH